MTVDHSHVPDAPHLCEPPAAMMPPMSTNEPADTRFFCDCGRVWIVRHIPDHNLGTQRVINYNSWFPESRRERRKRLGLKWFGWG